MHFNEHYSLKDKHAFLSASKYSWLRYSKDQLKSAYLKAQAKERGTALHKLAAEMVRLGVKAMRSKKTFYSYVNDVIGYRMNCEQLLYYSPYAFGTADAIAFDERDRKLLIFDLKTGDTPAHMDQLKIYAALFCLEYRYVPESIDVELRIYQSDTIIVDTPAPDEISDIMCKIKEASEVLAEMDSEVPKEDFFK